MTAKTFLRTSLTALATITLLAACDRGDDDKPKTGSLTHQLKLIGEDGRIYGRVELNPVGGGKIYDTEGNHIGTVITATGQ